MWLYLLEGRRCWVGDSRAFPAPNTFIWGCAFWNFMLTLIEQRKHWHSQTQFNLLSFIIVMRTNGSWGMEKKPLEEDWRVLRERDHRGERAWGQQQTWPSPGTFWTHVLVLYWSVKGSGVFNYRILQEDVQWGQHVRKQLPLRVEYKCSLLKGGPELTSRPPGRH